jgi:hypothetical protein
MNLIQQITIKVTSEGELLIHALPATCEPPDEIEFANEKYFLLSKALKQVLNENRERTAKIMNEE